MFNHDRRLFWMSFILTLLLFGWLAVFLKVDAVSAQVGGNSPAAALAVRRTDTLHYDVDFLGDRYVYSLEPYNELEKVRQEYVPLLTPRAVIHLSELYALGVWGWKHFYPMYKEYEFQQNIAGQ